MINRNHLLNASEQHEGIGGGRREMKGGSYMQLSVLSEVLARNTVDMDRKLEKTQKTIEFGSS